MKTPGEQFGLKKKNPNTVNKTFYLPSFLPFLFQILACFSHKTINSRKMSGGVFSCSFHGNKNALCGQYCGNGNNCYYQKDTPWPGKTFIQSCCSEKVYDVITRSHSYIYNYISGWGDGQTGQSLVV